MSINIEIGQKFSRLTVVTGADSNANKQRQWLCLCDCGNTKVCVGSNLINGRNISCGCLRGKSGSHGKSKTPTYRVWKAMRQRCLNPASDDFRYYGGRGIGIAQEWDSYERFLADMGERPTGKTIDRKNVNGDYTPENCRWATIDQQAINRRNNLQITFDGHTKTLPEWCVLLGVDRDRTYSRIYRQGWSFVDAVTVPVMR